MPSLCLCDSVFQTDRANMETQSHRGHGVISEGVSQLVVWGGFPETGVLTRVLHHAYYYIWAIYTSWFHGTLNLWPLEHN